MLLLRLQNAITQAVIYFESDTDKVKYPNVNSSTSTPSTTDDGGIIGDVAQQVTDGIVNGFATLGRAILHLVLPFAEWGCKFVIVGCVIIYFTSRDEKYISIGVKWFIVFIIVAFLEGVIQ